MLHYAIFSLPVPKTIRGLCPHQWNVLPSAAVSFGCLHEKTGIFFFYKGASKQTFSMRSRCVVTWLSGWLSVWLACDIDWQWQVKRFQRVFCCWATCWSRTHMGTELTLPEEPTGLWRDAARVSIIYCDTLQHWAP